MTRRIRKTAAELMAELEADGAFRAKRDERERSHAREVASNRAAERPVLERVKSSTGIEVTSLAELREHSGPELAQVLLAELRTIDRIDVKRAVIAAVPSDWVGPDDVAFLLALFDGADRDAEGDALRWAIASALVEMGQATSAEALTERLVDTGNGQARQMLALAVGATGDRSAVPKLVELLGDDVVNGHVVMALAELGAIEARSMIAPLARDQRGWVRDEVRRALARLSSGPDDAGG